MESFIHGTISGNGNLSNIQIGPSGLNTVAITVTSPSTSLSTTPGPLATNASPVAVASDHVLARASSHLPESPPDSGSEPPYSPSDVHTIPSVGVLPSYHLIHKPDEMLLAPTATPSLHSTSQITNTDALEQNVSNKLDAIYAWWIPLFRSIRQIPPQDLFLILFSAYFRDQRYCI